MSGRMMCAGKRESALFICLSHATPVSTSAATYAYTAASRPGLYPRPAARTHVAVHFENSTLNVPTAAEKSAKHSGAEREDAR